MLTRIGTGRAQDAFTLVELLVGMVLGMIVLAMVITLVVNTFNGGDRTTARTKAQRAAVLATEQLQADARAMRAPDRVPINTGSPDQFRSMLLRGQNPNGYQVHDVLVATPTTLTFFAELVNGSPNAECVTWAQQPDGSLRRTVRAYSAGCAGGGGAVQQDTELIPALPPQAAGAAAPPPPFSYRRLVQPNPAAAVVNPDACNPVQSTSAASDLERDQVTAVMFDLRAFTARRDGHGDQQLQTTVSIGSRQGIEYRYALGCAA